MKQFLIIGGGSIGKRHLKNLFLLGEKNVEIVEVDPPRIAELEKEFGIKVHSSLERALSAKKYDAAFICSPPIFHIENALICAKADCDLFIEKPLSHNMEGVDELLKIIQEKKLITMVGSNWKFYPLFKKMKELLESGSIGRVWGARCQFGQYLPDWHPQEDYRQGYSANKKLGGGILLDSHEFDYLTWFLGGVKKISCFAKKVGDLDIDVEDAAEAILEFENGAIGEIHLDYLQRFYQRNFEFFGEDGTMVWNFNDKKVVLKNKKNGVQEFDSDPAYDLNNMYIEEIKHFSNCVEKREETIMPVAQGKNILKLICAAKESAENDKIIYLPI